MSYKFKLPLPASIPHDILTVTISRGCRLQHIAEICKETKKITEGCPWLYDSDPFGEETIKCGTALLYTLNSTRQWGNEKIRYNNEYQYRIESDEEAKGRSNKLTVDQAAHQFIENVKIVKTPFTIKESSVSIDNRKNGKSASVDDISTKQLSALETPQNPAYVNVNIQKDPKLIKNYRHISLRCHHYQLYHRIRIVDSFLIPRQESFRRGSVWTQVSYWLSLN